MRYYDVAVSFDHQSVVCNNSVAAVSLLSYAILKTEPSDSHLLDPVLIQHHPLNPSCPMRILIMMPSLDVDLFVVYICFGKVMMDNVKNGNIKWENTNYTSIS